MIHDAQTLREHLLPQAKALVEAGEQRIAAQEARVAKLERDGRHAPESKRLLRIMRQTQALHVSHVRLLEREIEVAEVTQPSPQLRQPVEG